MIGSENSFDLVVSTAICSENSENYFLQFCDPDCFCAPNKQSWYLTRAAKGGRARPAAAPSTLGSCASGACLPTRVTGPDMGRGWAPSGHSYRARGRALRWRLDSEL